MAPPAGTLRVGRYFLALLAIIAVLYTIVFWPGARHTPKLGLDLSGGTQVIFTARTPSGKVPSRNSMNEAKSIMQQRVNGSGVTEATVVIQGTDQIVISIPGSTNTDVSRLGKAAALSMRGVVMPASQVSCINPATGPVGSSASPSPSTTSGSAAAPTASAPPSPNGLVARPLAAPPAAAPTSSAAPSAKATATPKPSGSATPGASTTPGAATPSGPATAVPQQPCVAQPFAGLNFTIPTSEAAFDKLTDPQKQQLRAALAKVDCTKATDQPDNAPSYFACDDGRTYGTVVAYLLGSVIVPGTEISSANAAAPNAQQGQFEWSVNLSMKTTGQANWDKYTSAHNLTSSGSRGTSVLQCSTATTPCANFVGFVLDGSVISAPVNNEPIHGGNTQITGNFTQTTAKELANQLKYGALPLSFSASTAQTVSPTLGSSQLKAGLLAGGIGLVLVVIYSLIYYRALGFVTISSLVVSGILVYGCLVMLGTQIGFTLSLAGIAGFIVAVGITADSFVVFFERIKDEVHDGRSIRVAIPRAWVRARRTILSADTVSFLAAAILYYFAAGDVKGFAFTLGLSTILDLVVVFLFTHPLVSLLSRSRAFGSARFTGLNAVATTAVAAPATRPATQRARAAATATKQPAAVASQEEASTSSLAILDWDEDAEVESPAEATDVAAEEDADERDAVAEEAAESEEPEEAEDSDEPAADESPAEPEPHERRRTTPEPGSAAERAAARRARMRAQADEKGNK